MRSRSETQLDRLSAFARREFSHAHLSDTKWRKMFDAIAASGMGLRQAVFKFIDVDEPKLLRFDAIHCFETHPVFDTIELGPIEFRAIEWFEVPAIARLPRANNLPAEEVSQDLDALQATLQSLGKYPFERSAEGLRVIGYSR